MRSICLLLVTLLIVSGVAAQPATSLSLPGSIAFVGLDGNVYSTSDQQSSPIALTDDASLERRYAWPTWSTDGRLAYFLTTLVGNQVETGIYISNNGQQKGELAYTATDEIFTYAYWSPQNCESDENCRDLAVLLSNPRDGLFAVRLIHNTIDSSEETLAGLGAPFYYSWSPDGSRMLWQRNNERIDIFDVVDPESLNTLPFLPGFFQAPAWSPVDDRWLLGSLAADNRSTELMIATHEETQVLVEGLVGPISFSWSPNGDYIAYKDANGPVHVIDSNTGENLSTTPKEGVFAFFWSPNSQNLAYITLAAAPDSSIVKVDTNAKPLAVQGANGIAWSVLNVQDGTIHSYGAFQPTQEMIYLLTFFDQFAQSHRIWSPDSRYLIYSEFAGNRSPIISVLDTTQPDTVPFSVAQGVIGIWSFNA